MNIASLEDREHHRRAAGAGVAVIVLAAGASTRMGEAKQLLPYRGRSLLRRAAEAAAGSVCATTVVVLGAHAERSRPELEGLPVRVAVNAAWAEGMGASIRAGLAELDRLGEAPAAVIVMLCDQPFVTAAVIDELVGAYRETGARVVASEYGGGRGVPALFAREALAGLRTLRADEGAKRLIADHAAGAHGVEFAGGAFDVDTKQDYDKLRETDG